MRDDREGYAVSIATWILGCAFAWALVYAIAKLLARVF